MRRGKKVKETGCVHVRSGVGSRRGRSRVAKEDRRLEDVVIFCFRVRRPCISNGMSAGVKCQGRGCAAY